MSAWQIVALIACGAIGWALPAIALARSARGPVRTAAIARDRMLGLYHPATEYRGHR